MNTGQGDILWAYVPPGVIAAVGIAAALAEQATSGFDIPAMIDKYGVPVVALTVLWLAYQRTLDKVPSALSENTTATRELTRALEKLPDHISEIKQDIREIRADIARTPLKPPP